MIESTYSVSSFSGLVSSKRRLVCPPNSSARPKSRQIALAWPMCRYPLGSGGKRVCTRPLYLLVLRSSRMMSRMKFEGRGSGAAFLACFRLGSRRIHALILPQTPAAKPAFIPCVLTARVKLVPFPFAFLYLSHAPSRRTASAVKRIVTAASTPTYTTGLPWLDGPPAGMASRSRLGAPPLATPACRGRTRAR